MEAMNEQALRKRRTSTDRRQRQRLDRIHEYARAISTSG